MKDIIKIEKEIAAEKEKLAKQQNRLRELENQKIEAENVYIVAIVRKSSMSIDELESITEKYKKQRKEIGGNNETETSDI